MRFKCFLNKITYIELRLLKISARNTNAFAHLKIFIQLIQKYTFGILPQKPLGGSLSKKKKVCQKNFFDTPSLLFVFNYFLFKSSHSQHVYFSFGKEAPLSSFQILFR